MSSDLNHIVVCVGTYQKSLLAYQLVPNESYQKSERQKLSSTSDNEKLDLPFNFSPYFGPVKHLGSIGALHISGHYLASGATDELIHLFDLKKKTEIGVCNEHSSSISSICLSGENFPPSMVSSDEKGHVIFWTSTQKGQNWEVMRKIRPHPTTVTTMSIHPSGRMALASSTPDRAVALLNLLNGKLAHRTNIKFKGGVQGCVWSPSGLLYGMASGTMLYVYDIMIGDAPLLSAQVGFRIVSLCFIKETIVICGGEKGLWCAVVISKEKKEEDDDDKKDSTIPSTSNEKKSINSKAEKRKKLNEKDAITEDNKDEEEEEDEDEVDDEDDDEKDDDDDSEKSKKTTNHESVVQFTGLVTRVEPLPILTDRIKAMCACQVGNKEKALPSEPLVVCACSDGNVSAWKINTSYDASSSSSSSSLSSSSSSSSSTSSSSFLQLVASVSIPNMRITSLAVSHRVKQSQKDVDELATPERKAAQKQSEERSKERKEKAKAKGDDDENETDEDEEDEKGFEDESEEEEDEEEDEDYKKKSFKSRRNQRERKQNDEDNEEGASEKKPRRQRAGKKISLHFSNQ
ncbi:putative p21-activated protein kinase-interacting protein 1-like [Monocercomonoides exilis]|uniref:putative p21-activated protein kinase-interacting protein 1-like n=1 Tax=Monocercomonoides exilis TaxID=2049356 RepID=UPI003559F5AF|nr:putative p21-activated protein kinase-interacting protein 1-like [Monocercomonoides exilis]|eukprot:MONOS_6531.1-p1 / transcript=MONOS_6531.1 / gene=MONOS_6531 / organism=Monocercomonoides_exilis_PA203 / gene_product=p21-activated protein kinase-interacting protein 1-like / transcript_product=p21-activated protein kinase-interacting protein 1-like / location=Mono_scaffold00207:26751-28663(-) / protein_length=573 / sequence_SO=supercontig / SO=protein_coding / is_pseudo=false